MARAVLVSLALYATVQTVSAYTCGDDICDTWWHTSCVINTQGLKSGFYCSKITKAGYCKSSGHHAKTSLYGSCGGYLHFDPVIRACNWPSAVDHSSCVYGDDEDSNDDPLNGADGDGADGDAEFTSGPCFINPCENNGACTPLGNVRTCDCSATDYTGFSCEIEKACAVTNPCNSVDVDGICMPSADFSSYTCQCNDDAYVGQHCEIEKACSTTNPCNAVDAGATCEAAFDFVTYTCACTEDCYTGPLCEIEIPCFSQPCSNDGVCVNAADFASRTCDCSSTDFFGDNCEIEKACALTNPCNTVDGAATCEPTADFSDFGCLCGTTHTGPLCDVELPCQTGTPVCQNGGICSDSLQADGSYTHSCDCSLSDYIGDLCEIEKACVFDNPCNQIDVGGVCVASADFSTFTCECTETMYEGDLCEIELACASSPCQNGGSCHNCDDSYACNCPYGFIGADCEIVPVQPDPNPSGWKPINDWWLNNNFFDDVKFDMNGYGCWCNLAFGEDHFASHANAAEILYLGQGPAMDSYDELCKNYVLAYRQMWPKINENPHYSPSAYHSPYAFAYPSAFSYPYPEYEDDVNMFLHDKADIAEACRLSNSAMQYGWPTESTWMSCLVDMKFKTDLVRMRHTTGNTMNADFVHGTFDTSVCVSPDDATQVCAMRDPVACGSVADGEIMMYGNDGNSECCTVPHKQAYSNANYVGTSNFIDHKSERYDPNTQSCCGDGTASSPGLGCPACLNGGIEVECTPGVFSCSCAWGWTGTQCEITMQQYQSTRNDSTLQNAGQGYQYSQYQDHLYVSPMFFDTSIPQDSITSLGASIDMLTISNYGCWCNLESSRWEYGRGEVVDVYDETCKKLMSTLRRIENMYDEEPDRDWVANNTAYGRCETGSIRTWVSIWYVDYLTNMFALGGSDADIATVCNYEVPFPSPYTSVKVIKTQCEIDQCIAYHTFLRDIVELDRNSQYPDDSFVHGIDFNPREQCNQVDRAQICQTEEWCGVGLQAEKYDSTTHSCCDDSFHGNETYNEYATVFDSNTGSCCHDGSVMYNGYCPCDHGHHVECHDGAQKCQCNYGWTGELCSVYMNTTTVHFNDNLLEMIEGWSNVNAVSDYGCYCSFHNNDWKYGQGEPVDQVDSDCKKLHDAYQCIEKDFADRGLYCDAAHGAPYELNSTYYGDAWVTHMNHQSFSVTSLKSVDQVINEHALLSASDSIEQYCDSTFYEECGRASCKATYTWLAQTMRMHYGGIQYANYYENWSYQGQYRATEYWSGSFTCNLNATQNPGVCGPFECCSITKSGNGGYMNQGVYEEVLYLDTNGGDYSCCTFGGNLTVVDHAAGEECGCANGGWVVDCEEINHANPKCACPYGYAGDQCELDVAELMAGHDYQNQGNYSSSLQTQLGMDLLEYLNGYGCWCSLIGDEYLLGQGEPRDQIDTLCMNLVKTYRCIEKTVNAQGQYSYYYGIPQEPTCHPPTQNYTTGILGGPDRIASQCYQANDDGYSGYSGQECEMYTCEAEGKFALDLIQYFVRGGTYDESLFHRNGFHPESQCEPLEAEDVCHDTFCCGGFYTDGGDTEFFDYHTQDCCTNGYGGFNGHTYGDYTEVCDYQGGYRESANDYSLYLHGK